jgi:hypothetical protein
MSENTKINYTISSEGKKWLRDLTCQQMSDCAARRAGKEVPVRVPLNSHEEQLLTFLANENPATLEEIRTCFIKNAEECAGADVTRETSVLHGEIATDLEHLLASLINQGKIELGRSRDRINYSQIFRPLEINPFFTVQPPNYPLVELPAMQWLATVLRQDGVLVGSQVTIVPLGEENTGGERRYGMAKQCDFCPRKILPWWHFSQTCCLCGSTYDCCSTCSRRLRKQQLSTEVCHRHDLALYHSMEKHRRRESFTNAILEPVPSTPCNDDDKTSNMQQTKKRKMEATDDKGKEKEREIDAKGKGKEKEKKDGFSEETQHATTSITQKMQKSLPIRIIYHWGCKEKRSLEFEDAVELRQTPARFAALIEARVGARVVEDLCNFSHSSKKRFFPVLAFPTFLVPTRHMQIRCYGAGVWGFT